VVLSAVDAKAEETRQSSQSGAVAAPDWKQALGLSCVLILATIAVYFRVNSFPFVNYDDTIYVTQNSQVQAGLTGETVHWAFTTYNVGTWHPITWMSHALDCQLFDVDPAGPHDVNLLLHVLNVVLLFWVLLRATGYTGRSFMVAALFALHPINVESVVWIAERKNSLSMLFFLLALGAYRWYTANPKFGRYITVALLFALGLMSKPQVITFPFVLLLWDYWPLRRISTNGEASVWKKKAAELFWEKAPLFALAAVSAAITMAAQRADGNKAWYPLSLRIEYALASYVDYLGRTLWPMRLSAFYPHPDLVPWPHVAIAVALLAAISILAVRAWRERPYLLVGWLFFLGTMVPMLGLEGVGYQGKQGTADRYAYLPFIGLFIMICWGVADWARQKKIPATALRVACAVVLLALGVAAYRQLGYWQDNVTLWTHAIAVTDGNFLAENNLGKALLNEGQSEEGVAHFYKAAAIYPDDPVSNLNIGIYEQKRGNYAVAIEHYQKTVSITRDNQLKAAAYRNMATCYRQLGNSGSAQQSEDAAAQALHQGKL
jgi:tetratricopeptide (TPR) repeat protein